MPRIAPTAYRRYLKASTAVVALALGIVLMLNLFADPFGAYRLVGGEKFATYKEGLSSRIGKGESLSHRGWNIVLLGNSRVEIGLDPQHPGWGAQRTYNAGLSGSDFVEMNLAARLAMKDPNLRRMVIGVDLGDFETRTPHDEYLKSLLNPELNQLEYHLATLLSIGATEKSITTIRNATQHRRAGDWRMGMLEVPLKTQGHADWTLEGYHDFFAGEEPLEHSGIDPKRMSALAALLDDASRKGIRVQLVELPVHAVYLQRLQLAGKRDFGEQWLSAVVKIVDAHNQRFPNMPVEFWDFTGPSRFTNETVPAIGQTTTQMRWFWDAAHFKRALGDLVIGRLTGFPPPAGLALDDFGVLLTTRDDAHHHRSSSSLSRFRPGAKRKPRRGSPFPCGPANSVG